jgi:hypothetical protein
VITRAIGMKGMVKVDLRTLDARPGDVYLLCTDGLIETVRDDRIRAVLTTLAPHDAAAVLVREAYEQGGRDNITVVVVTFDGDGLPEHADLQRMIGHQTYPLPDSGTPTLDRMRGRMRSGAVPAVTRPPTPPLGVQSVTPTPLPAPAISGAAQRDPAKARLYVTRFAITVLVGWAIWRFGNVGAP